MLLTEVLLCRTLKNPMIIIICTIFCKQARTITIQSGIISKEKNKSLKFILTPCLGFSFENMNHFVIWPCSLKKYYQIESIKNSASHLWKSQEYIMWRGTLANAMQWYKQNAITETQPLYISCHLHFPTILFPQTGETKKLFRFGFMYYMDSCQTYFNLQCNG